MKLPVNLELTQEAINLIMGEYFRTCQEYSWPDDIIHATAVMSEEAGETIRAANDVVHKGAPLSEVETEAIQTGAMCLRLIVSILEKRLERREPMTQADEALDSLNNPEGN